MDVTTALRDLIRAVYFYLDRPGCKDSTRATAMHRLRHDADRAAAALDNPPPPPDEQEPT